MSCKIFWLYLYLYSAKIKYAFSLEELIMVVLTAIAAFFKKIWDWIKQTAWIQPLLIVGIIFGVIFSIPAIVNAIKSAQEEADATENYYHKYQLSMEGNKDSAAYKGTDVIYKAMDNPSDENIAAVKEEIGATKFFFVFVSDTCPNCVEAKYGFDYLEKNWNNSNPNGGFYVPEIETAEGKVKQELKVISVFSDEYTSDTTSNKTAFVQYMEHFQSFFELSAEAAENTDYYALGKLSDADIAALAEAHPDNFLTPTILLIDFTITSPNPGVSEVMFGVEGDSDKDKAELLLHCWNHTDEFSVNS